MEANHVDPTTGGEQGAQAERIAALRADLIDTRVMMVEHCEWTIEQAQEVVRGVADAVKAGHVGELAFWCDWFAIRGEAARALRLVGVAVLGNMRRAA